MRRSNDVTSWEIFNEVGKFLVSCEGRFKGHDVIRWWGEIGTLPIRKVFASLEVTMESIVQSF